MPWVGWADLRAGAGFVMRVPAISGQELAAPVLRQTFASHLGDSGDLGAASGIT